MDPIDKIERLHQTMLGPDRVIEVPSHTPEELAEMRATVHDHFYGPYFESLRDGQEDTLAELTAQTKAAEEQIELLRSQMETAEHSLAELKTQNKTLTEQVEIAKASSRTSTRLSVLALLVAGASFVVALLTFLMHH